MGLREPRLNSPGWSSKQSLLGALGASACLGAALPLLLLPVHWSWSAASLGGFCACLLLWWRGSRPARRAQKDRIAAALVPMPDTIDVMAVKLGEQMQSARGELSKADQLLGDAIEQLVDAFDHAVRRASPAGPECATFDTDAAVTALQFRDMVGQKLGHVRDKLVLAEEVLYEIRIILSEEARPISADPARASPLGTMETRIRALLDTLQQVGTSTPVNQQRIQAGDIELF